MYHVISCDGYKIVGSAKTAEEAMELSRADGVGTPGIVNLIQCGGETIGDCVDGIYEPDRQRWVPPTDAATATGMYDRC